MAIKRWEVLRCDERKAQALSEATGIGRLLARVLIARGCDTPQKVEHLLADVPMEDPSYLADMDRAVERIHRSIDSGERICVYGDYDCDGITATVLLYTYLQTLGADVMFYIPDRDEEGYGLNDDAIDELAAQGIELLITVDNGVTAIDEVAHLTRLGIDVVVTDHHQPREQLPQAVAVVDPHRADCPSTFKDLAGVGVAFKLLCALEGAPCEEMLEYYGDLVCLGTIADIVPLVGENRVIARHGLECLSRTDNCGLQALLGCCGLWGLPITSENVSFMLAPKINAAGRLGFTDLAIRLLLCEEEETARELADELCAQNKARQALEAQAFADIAQLIEHDPDIIHQRMIVLCGEGWHPGVIGIVCSKIVERYGKPCLLLTAVDGVARGSGRSVEGFSLVDAISQCGDLLTRYGGHAMAVGFTLPQQDVGRFIERLLHHAAQQHGQMPVQSLRIDADIAPEELTVEQLQALDVLEPYGMGNGSPVFRMRSVRLEGVYPLGDGSHCRLRLSKGRHSFYAVYFGMSREALPFSVGDTLDIAACCDINTYNGEQRPSVKIRSIHPAGLEDQPLFDGVLQFDRYVRGEPLSPGSGVPSREEVAGLYRFLRAQGGWEGSYDALYFRAGMGQMDYCQMRLALLMMEELALIEVRRVPAGVQVALRQVAQKVDLGTSQVLKRARGDE